MSERNGWHSCVERTRAGPGRAERMERISSVGRLARVGGGSGGSEAGGASGVSRFVEDDVDEMVVEEEGGWSGAGGWRMGFRTMGCVDMDVWARDKRRRGCRGQ
eukprot:6749654-Prymnesium_polylepis.1